MDIFLESPIFGGTTIGRDYELYLWAALAQQLWLFWPDFTHTHAHTNVCRWIVLCEVWHRSLDSVVYSSPFPNFMLPDGTPEFVTPVEIGEESPSMELFL